MNIAQTFSALQGNPTADALVQAAASAPQQVQPRLYQQAAYKALEEGDTDRARQIANDHLSTKAREILMERINFREMPRRRPKALALTRFRQSVRGLQTDNEKLDLLVQIAGDTGKNNPKLAIQVLEEAKQIVNRRATSYQHLSSS